MGLIAASASADWDIPAGSGISLPGGAMTLGCTALTVEGTLTLGSTSLTEIYGSSIGATGIVSAGSSLISVSGSWNNNGTFIAGSSTVVASQACGGSTFVFSGNTTFYNLTLSGSDTTFVIPAGQSLTVLGTLTLQGTAGHPITLVSSSGAATIVLGSGANTVSNYANVSSSVHIGASTASIPTLDSVGTLLLILALLGLTSRHLHRRRTTPSGTRHASL